MKPIGIPYLITSNLTLTTQHITTHTHKYTHMAIKVTIFII